MMKASTLYLSSMKMTMMTQAKVARGLSCWILTLEPSPDIEEPCKCCLHRFGRLEELSSTNVELHQSHAKYIDDWQNNRNFLYRFSQCSFCKKQKRKSKILAYSDHISDAYRLLTIISYIIWNHMLYQKLHHSPSSIRSSVFVGCSHGFYFLLCSSSSPRNWNAGASGSVQLTEAWSQCGTILLSCCMIEGVYC